MTTKIYFSLQELLNNDNVIIVNTLGVEEVVKTLASRYIAGSISSSDSVSKKLMNHVWANISNKNILSFDVVHPRWVDVNKSNYDEYIDQEDYEYEQALLGQSIWSIYIDTQERYRTLIQLYEDELDNLLDPIDTSSETRFNDTPQNTLNSGTYADDNFTTTVTKSKVSTDGSSKMSRINEIHNMLRSLYADWAFEFNKLVIGE